MTTFLWEELSKVIKTIMSPRYTGKPEYVYFGKKQTDVKSLGKQKFHLEHCDLEQ